MRFFPLLFIFSLSLFAAPSLEVGGSLQVLVPNRLPDFVRTVSAYGPIVALPVGQKDKIELQAVYGGTAGISLFLAEATYRWEVPSPFISLFVLGGAAYLHHGSSGNDHNYGSPVAGFGVYFPMTQDFYLAMRMKAYYPQRTLLNFGGQFGYLF